MNVAEANVNQRLQLLLDLRNVFENRQRVEDRHFQQVGDGGAVFLPRQRLVVVAASAADLAEHVNIGQKIHLDAALALALASLATSAGNVEGNRTIFHGTL